MNTDRMQDGHRPMDREAARRRTDDPRADARPARRPGRRGSSTGIGYWAVQIGVSALLTLLGLGGGVFILIDVSRPGSTGTASVGDGVMLLIVGVVFAMLSVWLANAVVRQTRLQRAIYAWAIMQQHVARDPGLRPVRPASTVVHDVVAMATAQRAADGTLPLDEVLRLQAMRPGVPYPGDLGALRRRQAEQAAALLSPAARERQRAQWSADDAEALGHLDDAGILHRIPETIVRRSGTLVGWTTIGCFLLGLWTRLEAFGVGTVMALTALWCVLRMITGLLQDVRIRRGRALVAAWGSDPGRRRHGLPSPFAEIVRSPLGAWWMRLLTPATVLGSVLLVGGAANAGAATTPEEHRGFVGMLVVAIAILLGSIALRFVARRRSDQAADLLGELRGPRAAEASRRPQVEDG